MSKKTFKVIGIIVLIGLMVGGFFAYDLYKKVIQPNMPADLPSEYVHIPTNATFEEVVATLHEEGFILNKSTFEWTAKKMNYNKTPMRSGRYKVSPKMGNRALVTKLRSGAQAPVRVAIHNKRMIKDVAGLMAQYLEPDSLDFLMVMQDTKFLAEFGLDQATAMTGIIPNTYDFYWNSSPEDFFKKMMNEHDKFWNAERKEKATALGLTPEQVYTLGSIVERETLKNDEKNRIAGVYLNRLRKGTKLEADPTVVFAIGDFTMTRVLKKDLEIDSPYNTYKYAGLPPGPISMVNISTLERTLNAEDHDYMFFCAKPDGSGYHAFAKTFQGHLVNARRYWNRKKTTKLKD